MACSDAPLLPKEVGARLRRLRLEAGLTQAVQPAKQHRVLERLLERLPGQRAVQRRIGREVEVEVEVEIQVSTQELTQAATRLKTLLWLLPVELPRMSNGGRRTTRGERRGDLVAVSDRDPQVGSRRGFHSDFCRDCCGESLGDGSSSGESHNCGRRLSRRPTVGAMFPRRHSRGCGRRQL